MSNASDSQPLPFAPIGSSRDNPRRDFDDALDSLARSIARVGLLEPIVVRPIREHFELVAGERRYRACLQLGMDTIAAIVRSDLSDLRAAEVRLFENLHRREFNPIEEAIGFRRLRDLGHMPETLAALVRRFQGRLKTASVCFAFRQPGGTAFRPARSRRLSPLTSWRKRLNDAILESFRPMDGEHPAGPRFTSTTGELRPLDVVTIRPRPAGGDHGR